MKPIPKYKYLFKEKQEGHDEMMRRNLDEDNWTLDTNFYKKVIKRIKDKNKVCYGKNEAKNCGGDS